MWYVSFAMFIIRDLIARLVMLLLVTSLNSKIQFLTTGALHYADASTLRNATLEWMNEFASLPKSLVVVNIGGPTSKHIVPLRIFYSLLSCIYNCDYTSLLIYCRELFVWC